MPKSKSKKKSDKIYYVEKILKKKIDANGKARYLVKWQKYSAAWNSWEPIEMFKDPAIVDNFEAQLAYDGNKENQSNLQNQPRKPRKHQKASSVEVCPETNPAIEPQACDKAETNPAPPIEPQASCVKAEMNQAPDIEPQDSCDEECSEPNPAPAIIEPQAAQPPPNAPVWITKAFLGMSHATPQFISLMNETFGGVDPLGLNGFEFEFECGSKRELTLMEACVMIPGLVDKYLKENPEVRVYVMTYQPKLEHEIEMS